MSNPPHIIIVPFPAQGHVMPLMELAQILVKHDIKITFVNTEFCHQRIMNSSFGKKAAVDTQIQFVSVPGGMSVDVNKKEISKQTNALYHQVMPGELKQLIEEDGGGITCVVVDTAMAWLLEVAAEMGIKGAALCPTSALSMASTFNISKMVHHGIIDENGTSLKREKIQLFPNIPPLNPLHFMWLNTVEFMDQKILFEAIKRNVITLEKTEWILCNSTYDLEANVFASFPKFLPVGPLPTYEGVKSWLANFWPEDESCLNWLDKQPHGSVVYIAFGSLTVFNQSQFRELAMGLQLLSDNIRFLWVVRPDVFQGESDDYYPEGFLDKVANRGKIVSWAPQRAVLSHPSIACFVSHCGWNSTIEGISNGVPFVCWPFYVDQFWNGSYICEVLRVGYELEKDDESGIIRREEIKNKVEKVVRDEKMKERALELMEKTRNSVKDGGLSDKNLKSFIQWLKSENSL